jgi:AmmeMemoRadiSam system protein B
MSATCRPPAVAGTFYPGIPAELAACVDALLDAAEPPAMAPPKVLVVPHAGYIYSGSTAALAYATLAPARATIHRVVLLGPTHRVAVNGIAMPACTHFSTPFGDVPLDLNALGDLADLPGVVVSDLAHAREHSLEVHLPFLQRSLDAFTLVPLAVGHAAPERVAEVIERVWGGPETLIVVSSDLSHFLPYAAAQERDRATCAEILAGNPAIDPQQACGAFPLNGLALVAQRRHLPVQLLRCCNSGDTAGDKSRVVGYAAFAYHEPATA